MERKGRSKAEVDAIICWLTGYSQKQFEAHLADQTYFEVFFAKAPRLNPARRLITGVIGGIRFDKSQDNKVSVVMPYDGYVMRANRSIEAGEIQYDFDIVNPCGIMIRLGHLRELTLDFQEIADKLPEAKAGDSRTTPVSPMVPFKRGDLIASVVGFKDSRNVGFDYGVYDLRSDNQASKDPAYKAAHADTAELSFHGLCWLDLLNSKDTVAVKALPAGDQAAGKTSDYCK